MIRRVVVAGAGFGGLVAARVLADLADQVIVVERDELPSEPAARAGTPQDVHPHQLLTAARLELERLFPGFTDEAIARTARFTCITRTHKIWGRLGWRPRYDSDLHALVLSRHLIDSLIRDRVLEIPNVEVITGRRAAGLVTDSSGAVVTGLRTLDPESGSEEVLSGDLVVDATGRSSKARSWLSELGFPEPTELMVNAFYGYTSCFVQLPEGCEPEFEGIGGALRGEADPGPLKSRAAGMFKIEGSRRWILSAVGIGKDHPPGDPEEFRTFIRGLGVQELTELVDVAKMLSEPKAWRSTANRFRRFDLLASFPENFVLLGDSVANLNPVYGQGMSLAAWGARDLGIELAAQDEMTPNGELTGLSQRFQKRLAESLQVPWGLSSGSDAALPTTELNFELDKVVDVEFMRRLDALAMIDEEIALRFVETGHLVRSPEWMQDPELRARVEQQWDELGSVQPSEVR